MIYDRVWNRKNYFEIAAFLNFERGPSRAGNSNENKNINKHISVWHYFEFSCSWYSSFNWQKGGNFKIIFPVPYSIIYNPDITYIPFQQTYIFKKMFFQDFWKFLRYTVFQEISGKSNPKDVWTTLLMKSRRRRIFIDFSEFMGSLMRWSFPVLVYLVLHPFCK